MPAYDTFRELFQSFCFDVMLLLCCCGHAISQIHIFFYSFSFNMRSGLLDVVVFQRLNSKFHNSFALSFSITVPLFHRSSYHIMSVLISSCSFAHAAAIIIIALLCLVRYSVFAKTLHAATRC